MNSGEFKSISQDLSGWYLNEPYQSTSENDAPSLLELFNLTGHSTDTIKLFFIDSSRLCITFKDSMNYIQEKQQFVFEGEFSRKGFFEVYHKYKRVEIPPLFPIIYSSVYIDRIRVTTKLNGDLAIEQKWVSGSNLFLFAAGQKEKYINLFKTVEVQDRVQPN